MVLVDLRRRQRIEEEWLASRCGWSPFAGREVVGWPVATILRGHVVMREGELRQPVGRPVRFADTLTPEA